MKIPEGWPTEEMVEAGYQALCGVERSYDRRDGTFMNAVFKAMFAAAPTPPAQEEDVRFGPVAMIMHDVCEAEPANPDLPDTICINVDDLKLILDECIKAPTPTAPESRGSDDELVHALSICQSEKLLLEEEIAGLRAPAAPAQNDEPVYQMITEDGYWRDCDKAAHDTYGSMGVRVRILYTHPDTSELRKAAEEVLCVLDDPNPTGMGLMNARDNLRAALNKEKS